MEILKTDGYDEVAATYQCLEIGRLNETLLKFGITEEAVRRQICAEFITNSGQFLDSGWFVSEEKRYYPSLGFVEKPIDATEPEKLHLQTVEFNFHEYAAGDIEWYFDEHDERTEEIEHGIL